MMIDEEDMEAGHQSVAIGYWSRASLH